MNSGPTTRDRSFCARHTAEIAASATAVIALMWFASRLSGDIVAGPWQALFLSQRGPYPLPFVTHWIWRMVDAIPVGTPLQRLNILAMVLGAGSSAAVAAAATLAARRFSRVLRNGWALVPGLFAGVAFALTPAVTSGAAGHPAMVGTCCAVVALALLTRVLAFGLFSGAEESSINRRETGTLFFASVALGLAVADSPPFAVLLVLFAFVAIAPPARRSLSPRLTAFILGVAPAAALPLVAGLTSGAPLAESLADWLYPPSVALATNEPAARFGLIIRSYDVLTPTLVGTFLLPNLLLRHRHRRIFVYLWGGAFLCMGPVIALLGVARGYGAAGLLARQIVATAALWLGVACLLAAVWSSRPARPRIRRFFLLGTALLLAWFLRAAWFSAQDSPNYSHHLAETTVKTVLADCPENAILVAGTEDLAGTLLAVQATANLRPDVIVLHAGALAQGRMRTRLRQVLGDTVVLADYPRSDESVARLTDEQPALLDRAVDEGTIRTEPGARVDLALWELVRDNLADHPLCFVGYTSSWLAARACAHGTVLRYPTMTEEVPGPGTSSPTALESVANACLALNLDHEDPAMARLAGGILLGRSVSARHQGNPSEALRLARLAARLEPDAPSPRLAMARAAGRSGDREGAARHTAAYLNLAGPSQSELVARAVAFDTHTHAAAEEFLRWCRRPPGIDNDGPVLEDLAMPLWACEEYAVLAEGYNLLLQRTPNDVDIRYEQAAALAQLGLLVKARESLLLAFETSPMAIVERAAVDGRFALLWIASKRTGLFRKDDPRPARAAEQRRNAAQTAPSTANSTKSPAIIENTEHTIGRQETHD